VPDRSDLSGPADLAASLRLVAQFCRVADIEQISTIQRHRIQSARTYLGEQREVVERWLADRPTTLGATAIIPRPATEAIETTSELRGFGDLVTELTPSVLALAARRDTVYAVPPYDGHIMGLDLARHLVRVVCSCTIDRGWGYPD
jgi:hypothetical protein